MFQLTSKAFRHFFDHAPVALVVHDRAGRIVHANRESIRDFQRPLDELLSLTIKDVLLIGNASIGPHAVDAISSEPSAS